MFSRLSSLAFLLAIAACTSDDRERLVVYSPHGKELLEAYELAFEAEHPDVDVVWLDMGAQDAYDRIRTESANPQASLWWGAPQTLFAQAAREGLLQNFRPSWADGGENIIHVFVLPDTSMGASTAGLVYRFSQNTLPGVHNAVFIDERAADGDDTDLPFTFGHELGHILDLGHVDGTFQKQNLMYFVGLPNEREGDLARKRLEEAQVNKARRNGPGSGNPILEQN